MKFQRKPIIIEANQFHPDALPWPKGVIRGTKNFIIPTLDGWMVVKSGDWVIEYMNKYDVIKPDEFEAAYENVR